MRSGENGSGRGEVVRVSIKFPLILQVSSDPNIPIYADWWLITVAQHSGHSRTIVGYEENARGDVNLLLFDPGK